MITGFVQCTFCASFVFVSNDFAVEISLTVLSLKMIISKYRSTEIAIANTWEQGLKQS